MFCGKQGLSFRGIEMMVLILGKEVNLQIRAISLSLFISELKTDEVLANHLKNVPRNALYTSKTIQNSLIEVVRQRILRGIISKVNRAKYYTIVADEVTDLSNKEQPSLALRYVLHGREKEVFVDFMFVERITGEMLAQAILQWFATWNLPHSDIRGQCYDGESNMAGAQGVWQSFSKKPQKLFTSIAPHTVSTWRLFQHVVYQLSKT